MLCWLLQVADYWRMVIDINDYQKQRYVERVIGGMFNTVSNKKIAVRGMQHDGTRPGDCCLQSFVLP